MPSVSKLGPWPAFIIGFLFGVFFCLAIEVASPAEGCITDMECELKYGPM